MFTMIRSRPVLATAKVYCPLCTHTVEAVATRSLKRPYTRPGQRCPRCTASLDAAYVWPVHRAA